MKSVTTGVLLVLLGQVLSACSTGCPDEGARAIDKNRLEAAALYPSRRSQFAIPVDAWTKNTGLEDFVHDTVGTSGIKSLAQYGMQCTPSLAAAACTDCFTCTKSFHDYRLGMASGLPIYMEMFRCVDYGEMLMHVAIGPGSRTEAMTYWKTTPQARENRE